MRTIVILTPESKKESWVTAAREVYLEKLKHFTEVKWVSVKSPAASREQADKKTRAEQENLLKALKPQDTIVLLDERGKSQNSQQFSKFLTTQLESSAGRLVFIVGGAFGVGDEIQKRAQCKLSLSSFVLAHPIAHVVLLEQLYRAFAIARGLPYHND